MAGFTAARVSGGSSIMTTARPDRARWSPQPFGPAVGHYAVPAWHLVTETRLPFERRLLWLF